MYDKKQVGFYADTGTAGFSLASAAVVGPKHNATRHCAVKRVGVKVVAAIVSSGAIVINVRKRPIPHSSSGQSSLGTITIPAAAAVGDSYYLELDEDQATFRPGEQLALEVTTAAAGMGAAGNGQAWIDAEDNPKALIDDTSFIKVTA